MFNLIRMYIYRLVRMKSFYVILIILAFMNVTMPILAKDPTMQEIDEQIEQNREGETHNDTVGMSVIVHSEGDGNYTFYQLFVAPLTALMYTLFIGIFTVIFATADFSTGDIKNFGGSLNHRYYMPVAKAVTIGLYTVFFFLFAAVTGIGGIWISGGKVLFRDMGNTCAFLGVQLLLHVAFAVTIMACCQIIRSNLLSMILTCCISMNVMNVLYNLISRFLDFIGIKNVKVYRYVLSGRIADYTLEKTNITGSTIVIAVIFITVSLVASGWWTTKHDLV